MESESRESFSKSLKLSIPRRAMSTSVFHLLKHEGIIDLWDRSEIDQKFKFLIISGSSNQFVDFGLPVQSRTCAQFTSNPKLLVNRWTFIDRSTHTFLTLMHQSQNQWHFFLLLSTLLLLYYSEGNLISILILLVILIVIFIFIFILLLITVLILVLLFTAIQHKFCYQKHCQRILSNT